MVTVIPEWRRVRGTVLQRARMYSRSMTPSQLGPDEVLQDVWVSRMGTPKSGTRRQGGPGMDNCLSFTGSARSDKLSPLAGEILDRLELLSREMRTEMRHMSTRLQSLEAGSVRHGGSRWQDGLEGTKAASKKMSERVEGIARRQEREGELMDPESDDAVPRKVYSFSNLFKTFPGRRCTLASAHESVFTASADWVTAGILVAHKGRLVYERYAPTALPSEQIELDSAAKTVSALLLGVLVTQGKLDIDRPLAQYKVKPAAYWGHLGTRNAYLAEAGRTSMIGEHQEYWPLITARHLMTHTSGLGKGPPGVTFEYNSGEHIQHLSALIRVLTSERYSSPVDWAEDQFAKPLGLQGLFAHDGLDGDISIGGGQLMSCSQLARIGQLMINWGRWPLSAAPTWPLDWLPWATNRTEVFQLVSKEYIREMTRPSFPQVVSTYGMLLWINHAVGPDDTSCCMCTCGACFGVPDPPIFGINEEAWFATGYLTRYLIMLPERETFVVSLGMDLTGSTPCSVSWSWLLGPSQAAGNGQGCGAEEESA
ncbi:Beta-lactamase domain-containing protein [Durusdinium trenchii]|uniref:Beta-lactamase domain-containing protein n=1 Tax=Durusdinium trenchii TaxID=1381693 RepID=A0ABP0IMA4_9DINO